MIRSALPGGEQGREEDPGTEALESEQDASPFKRGQLPAGSRERCVSKHTGRSHTKRRPPYAGAACPGTWPPPSPFPEGISPARTFCVAWPDCCAAPAPPPRPPKQGAPADCGPGAQACAVVTACYCRLRNGRQNPSCAART